MNRKALSRIKAVVAIISLRRPDLVALLLEQSAEEMPTSRPRASEKERRRANPVKIISRPQEMDEFEKEEMKNNRLVVKNKLNEWYDWLNDHIPKPI